MSIENEAGQDNQEQESQLSPIEQKAAAGGWVPQDQWKGDPDEWKDAKTFVREGEMMDRIKRQGAQLEQYKLDLASTREAIKSLGEHNKKIAEIEYEKAMKELKKQKVQALKNEDHETVIEIDEEIDNLKERKKEVSTPATPAPEENPDASVVREWINNKENSWYKTDFEMHKVADEHFTFLTTFQGKSVSEALKETDSYIRNKFPDKFGTMQGSPFQQVAEPGVGGKAKGGKKKYAAKDLSDEQRSVGNTLVKSGAFENIQEYVDQLAALGEIPSQRGN